MYYVLRYSVLLIPQPGTGSGSWMKRVVVLLWPPMRRKDRRWSYHCTGQRRFRERPAKATASPLVKHVDAAAQRGHAPRDRLHPYPVLQLMSSDLLLVPRNIIWCEIIVDLECLTQIVFKATYVVC